jgi:hypothetical protein
LARRGRVRSRGRRTRSGSGVGRNGSSGRDRKRTIATRKQAWSNGRPCEKVAGKEGEISVAQSLGAEEEGPVDETSVGKIEACCGEEGAREDQALSSEKYARQNEARCREEGADEDEAYAREEGARQDQESPEQVNEGPRLAAAGKVKGSGGR